MSFIPIGADEWFQRESRTEAALPGSKMERRLQLAGAILRTGFIVSLLVVIARVSMPQSATVWTAYDSPGDLIRVALGFAAFVWIGFQLFAMPKDADSHRMWLYLGLAVVPFALICMIGVW